MVNDGIGFLGALQVAFIVLKLLGEVSFGWFMVFLPFTIGVGIWIITFLILAIVTTVTGENFLKH